MGKAETTYLGDVHIVEDIEGILADPLAIEEMRKRITDADCYIVKGVLDPELLESIREYLTVIGRSSMPNYQPILPGAPNSHRINNWDPRAYVNGCFHQFQFLPWNQDVFGLFEKFDKIYQLKNQISGHPADSFLGTEPQDGVTARLAFQYYPRGIGGLNMHSDPVDRHQLTIPTVLLSEKGRDYDSGGLVVEKANGDRIDVDPVMDMGDALFFRADTAHGVATVDPEAAPDWMSFEGRWMVVVAVNKTNGIPDIIDAVDLGAV